MEIIIIRETVTKQMLFPALLVIIIIISGCGSYPLSDKEQQFANIISIPYDDLNDKFRLAIPRGLDDIRFGSQINLELLNDSRDAILFPANFGITIFTFNETTDSWAEINNLVEYLPVGVKELYPLKKDSLGGGVIGVYPDIEDFTQPITIRVLMVGEVIREGISTNEFAGSYIDITISP